MRHGRMFFGWKLLMFLIALGGLTAITMLLWNALIPQIFGGIVIDYWQALGLLVLSRLFFGGFGFHHFHDRFHKHKEMQTAHMHNLSPDERRDFIRQRMRNHGWCGGGDPRKEYMRDNPAQQAEQTDKPE